MASLFAGNAGYGLRHQYSEVTNSDISATSDASDAVLVCTFRNAARMAFLFNSTSFDLSLFLVHPNLDGSVVENRLFWMEYPANYNLNYDNGSVNWEFDPGTKLYVSKASGTSSSGKLRVITWG